MQETGFRSLGREDPLEKEMAIRASILAWRIPWTEESGGLQSMGSQKSQICLSDQTHTALWAFSPHTNRKSLLGLIPH